MGAPAMSFCRIDDWHWSQPQKEAPFINKRRSTNVGDAEVDA
jgi:hypothetical protein